MRRLGVRNWMGNRPPRQQIALRDAFRPSCQASLATNTAARAMTKSAIAL